MARTAAARALSMTGASLARRFDVGLACAADDERVRRLLREHALPGDVALTFEREPDSMQIGRASCRERVSSVV